MSFLEISLSFIFMCQGAEFSTGSNFAPTIFVVKIKCSIIKYHSFSDNIIIWEFFFITYIPFSGLFVTMIKRKGGLRNA